MVIMKLYSLSRILPYFKPYISRTVLALGLAIPIGALDAVIALSLKALYGYCYAG